MKNKNCGCHQGGKCSKNWMWLLFIGLLLGAMGVYVTFQPLEGYLGLAIVFGWAFVFTGVGKIIVSLSGRKYINGWGWYLVYGILSLILGIYLIMNLGLTLISLPIIFAFWLMLQGTFLTSSALAVRSRKGWGWLLAGGVLALAAGFLLLFNPLLSFLSVMIWTGIGLYVAAFAYIVMAMQVCRIDKETEKSQEQHHRQ